MSLAAARRAPAAIPPQDTLYAFAGHSGARVVLHAGGTRSFVRKTAAAPNQNERLIDQAEKQRHLARIGIPFPPVFASGIDDAACAFFDMAYVPGRTVAYAVANSIPFAPGPVFAAVERMLWLFQACRGATLPARAFHDKIETIARDGDDTVRACAALLKARDWDGIPDSPSHGDLTLENIMLGPERNVVFIDCDRPWVSSYWLDMGKLFQDLVGHWCLRRLYGSSDRVQRANAIEKLSQLENVFRPLIAREEPGLAERLHQLAALNLFRALPYTVDRETAAFIATRIHHVLER
ncbi:MAG TPA: phosphotransferase [Rhizomicrobium sp.]|nr:phosphotransferase [Rhizomicrobium sp.]